MKKRKELEELIYSIVHSLPPNQKKVADFFLENIDLVALLPIKDIALKANVSEASIVRFAQSLGYKGFKELKAVLSTTLKNKLSPTEYYQFAVTEKEKTPDIITLVANNVITNINDTLKSINYYEFSNVVDSIMKARQIYCLGLEISYQFASMLTFLLRLYGYDAHTLSLNFLHYQEQIAFLTEDDLLVAFSFSPYSRPTIEAVSYASERKIPVIAFTDKKIAPVNKYSTHCLQIKTDNIMFTNSLGAVAVVINAIITELNLQDKERTLHALEIIEKNINDSRYFITD